MIVFQVPATVGGTVLIIDRIESQNFVTGVSGWAIKANGTAEFFNLISRGSFIGGTVGGRRVEINGSLLPGGLAFYSGVSSETAPGNIQTSASALDIVAPTVPGIGSGSLRLGGDSGSGGQSQAALTAGEIGLSGNATFGGVLATGSYFKYNNVPIATTTDVQTLTNKDLASSTNTFPASLVTTAKSSQRVESGTGSFTVDASGAIALPCTLGVRPVTALVSFQNSQYFGTADLNTSTATVVNVFIRNVTVAGAPVLAAGTVVTCRYFYTT